MTKVYTAPDIKWEGALDFRIFLAGAIDMGEAPNWQAYVIEQLHGIDNLSILNPRREKFTPGTEVPQIEWELNALHRAHLIFLWLPKDAKAPISLLEFGMYVRTRLPVLLPGVEPGFYRERNVQMTARFWGVECYHNLDDMILEVQNRRF